MIKLTVIEAELFAYLTPTDASLGGPSIKAIHFLVSRAFVGFVLVFGYWLFSDYTGQAGPEIMIFLPLSPEC